MYTYLIKLNTKPEEKANRLEIMHYMNNSGFGEAEIVADEPDQVIFKVCYEELKEADMLITRLQNVKELLGRKYESIVVYIVLNQLKI